MARATKRSGSSKRKASAQHKKSGPKTRASWRGMLRFGLVSFPVQAVNALAREKERLAFHQLHETCHSRLHHEKVCPIHGPVTNDEVLLGYEYKKGEYVEVAPEEFEKLRPAKERALTIDAFVSPEEIDPIYFDGRTYYLAPDGPEAAEPYAIFERAMTEQERWGVGQVIFSGRQHLVVVRSQGGLLQMALLHFAAAIEPTTVIGTRLPAVSASDKKLELAKDLIENWGDENFDISHYVDRYETEMKKLIDAKVRGHELVEPEEEEEAPVYNLMDALRKSMEHNSSRRKPSNHKREDDDQPRASNGRQHSAKSSKRPKRRKAS